MSKHDHYYREDALPSLEDNAPAVPASQDSISYINEGLLRQQIFRDQEKRSRL